MIVTSHTEGDVGNVSLVSVSSVSGTLLPSSFGAGGSFSDDGALDDLLLTPRAAFLIISLVTTPC